jgi:hypothetical protein
LVHIDGNSKSLTTTFDVCTKKEKEKYRKLGWLDDLIKPQYAPGS